MMVPMKQHAHSRNERAAQKLRVRRIVGQLNAIERMLDEDRDCSEILMQMVSARKALKSLAETVIHSHMQHCIEHAHSPAEGRKHLEELLVVLKRYVE
jgi:DNA-binding FrmR family transcriptional regulator